MKVILTHEQADMDALASLLGAWLIFPDALPLLPRNINRNGRRFLEDFEEHLPFVAYEDLPHEDIDQIILVDTQSLITLKGMSESTQVTVYDHHPRKDDLNPNWELHLTTDGANTSQMIGRIREQEIKLDPVQANLLCLGLYEDTGSFSYGSTRPEDLRAAAFCLAEGADLDVIIRYLYPPLSKGQQKLYERLLKTVQTYTIDEHDILTAHADATDVHDEISSVAHKLRDVLTPDALLLLVSTRQGIRLVARSTRDEVDVSILAEKMGGGGHRRAASALIRPDERLDKQQTAHLLEQIYQEMIADLDLIVHPAFTVGSIMSRDPLLLSPTTSVAEAHRLMQRYGYEGFPVVAQDQVVGLLNRREVDRAMAHKLNLTVESLMTAGHIVIRPGASLEELQSLMGTTSWGQIPVVNDAGQIIGIVTRTDLIKTLTPTLNIPSQADITQRLSEVVPPPRLTLLRLLAEVADRINVSIFVVGGFVRDLLLDRPSLDFDIVVEGDAIFFANRLADTFGGSVITHRRFGTARWDLDKADERLKVKFGSGTVSDLAILPDSLDLITARTEFYEQPAALPTIESSSIKMDLHRRDFTINTLALRLDGAHFGQIYDYWGGLRDLQEGKIRVLHALSFVDDATRLLRAVRFEQRFGFQIEPRTLALLEESLPLLDKLTGARLRHEINLILLEDSAADMLARLDDLGILQSIHPEIPWHVNIYQNLTALKPETIDPVWGLTDATADPSIKQTLSYLIWFGHLSENAIQSVASRFRLKADLKKLIRSTSRLLHALDEAMPTQPSQWVELLQGVPRSAIYAVFWMSPNRGVKEHLIKYVRAWADVSPITTGDTLRQKGLKPSPAYGEILTSLRNAWLDGVITSYEEEQALLASLMDQYQ